MRKGWSPHRKGQINFAGFAISPKHHSKPVDHYNSFAAAVHLKPINAALHNPNQSEITGLQTKLDLRFNRIVNSSTGNRKLVKCPQSTGGRCDGEFRNQTRLNP